MKIYRLILVLLSLAFINSCSKNAIDPASKISSYIKMISVSEGNLDRNFDPFIYSYNVEVAFEVEKIDIVVVPQFDTSEIYVNTKLLDKSNISKDNSLVVGLNEFKIHVVSKFGIYESDYTLIVNRKVENVEDTTIPIVIPEEPIQKDYTEVSYIKEEPVLENSLFGQDFDVWEDTLVAGSYYDQSISIYKLSNNSWNLVQKIKNPKNDTRYKFGTAVAIFKNKIAVAASTSSGYFDGILFIYEKDNSTWVLKNELKPVNDSLIGFGGYFDSGEGIAMSEKVIVVGEPIIAKTNDIKSFIFSGRIFIFEEQEKGVWEYSSISKEEKYFGYSVAVSEEGKTVAVGSFLNLYIYEKIDKAWILSKTFKAENNEILGESVSISKDTIAATSNSKTRIYSKKDGVWKETQIITEIGQSIDILNDTIVLGTPSQNLLSVFKFNNNFWKKFSIIKANSIDVGDLFGTTVKISNENIFSSSKHESSNGSDRKDNSVTRSGAIYMFR